MTIKINLYNGNTEVDSVRFEKCAVIPRVGDIISVPHYFESQKGQMFGTVFRVIHYKLWIDIDVK